MIGSKTFRYLSVSFNFVSSILFFKEILINFSTNSGFSHFVQFILCVKQFSVINSIFKISSGIMLIFYSNVMILGHHTFIAIWQIQLSSSVNFLFAFFIFLIYSKVINYFFFQHLYLVFFNLFVLIIRIDLIQYNFINLHSLCLMVSLFIFFYF